MKAIMSELIHHNLWPTTIVRDDGKERSLLQLLIRPFALVRDVHNDPSAQRST
jgi:hypothetical protein